MGEAIAFSSQGALRIAAALRNAADVEPVLDARHLVRGWLGEGGLSVLYGPSNAGKTFVALSLAAHIAAGKPWQGCEVRGGRVLYMALEGGTGFLNRVAAIRQHLPELRQTRNLSILPLGLDLYSPQGLQELCDGLPSAEWDFIVVDTLARAMAGADENAARDMGQLVGNLDRLRELTGAAVMVVHHSGKNADAGARGSSALRAAVDTELSLSSEGKLTATKQRDMRAADPLHFQLEDVELGLDRDGMPVTSAVAVGSDAAQPRPKPLSGKAEVAMQALRKALSDHGVRKTGPDYPPNRPCVVLPVWRKTCQLMGLSDPEDKPDTKRRAFNRAKEALIERDRIRLFDGHVWEVTPIE